MVYKSSRVYLPSRRGFTLIELLVVIAIIGLLASIVLASLNSARSKARDARRESDLHQLQTALELYYSSNGIYPGCNLATNNLAGYIATIVCLRAALAPTYIGAISNDPQYPNASYFYDNACSNPAGGSTQYYRLVTTLENPAPNNPFTVWGPNSFGYTTCVTAT